MGAIFSSTANGNTNGYGDLSPSRNYKRQRLVGIFNEETARLIPCLPDEVSIQILARLPRMCYYNVRLVSKSWRAAVSGSELYCLRKDLGKAEEWLYVLAKVENSKLLWLALDPLSKKWRKSPPMPLDAFDESSPRISPSLWLWNLVAPTIRIADVVRSWLGRRDSPDQMRLSGCSIAAIDGCLYVLGGFSSSSTMSCVWKFDPVLNAWSKVDSMSTGRAYCKTGILNNKLYVVGGVSKGPGGFNPLQSAEVFDPSTGSWSGVPSMPFQKAQVLPTAFLAGMLKPIATGMTSYMGKLCVPQSLYSWPFIVDVGGEMFDPETNSWVEMPSGMGEGWPARQAGTKLSVVVDEELYALDPSGSLDSGKIKVYDKKEDAWKVAISKVPLSDVVDSESPYLLAGLHQKLHLITKDSSQDIAVLQAEPQCSSEVESPTALPSFFNIPFQEGPESQAEMDTVVWKVISSKSFASVELVGCTVIDL